MLSQRYRSRAAGKAGLSEGPFLLAANSAAGRSILSTDNPCAVTEGEDRRGAQAHEGAHGTEERLLLRREGAGLCQSCLLCASNV